MRIRFVQDTQNHLTGNTLRRTGEVMDLREDYAAALISQGRAVDVNAPILIPSESAPVVEVAESEPEPEPKPAPKTRRRRAKTTPRTGAKK